MFRPSKFQCPKVLKLRSQKASHPHHTWNGHILDRDPPLPPTMPIIKLVGLVRDSQTSKCRRCQNILVGENCCILVVTRLNQIQVVISYQKRHNGWDVFWGTYETSGDLFFTSKNSTSNAREDGEDDGKFRPKGIGTLIVYLFGGFKPVQKYMLVKLDHFPQKPPGWKNLLKKNVWNHQLVIGFMNSQGVPRVDHPETCAYCSSWWRSLPQRKLGSHCTQRSRIGCQCLWSQKEACLYTFDSKKVYGCFQKYGKTPEIIHFKRGFHYKPSILGYHCFLEKTI